jgi:hypothetical protein
VYQKQTDPSKGTVIGKLLDWLTTAGQRHIASLGYAPLPANAVALARETILQLEDPSGQPLFSK